MSQPTPDTALFLDSLPSNPIPFYRAAEEHLQALQDAGVKEIDDKTKRILWIPVYIDKGQAAKIDLAKITKTYECSSGTGDGRPLDPVTNAKFACRFCQVQAVREDSNNGVVNILINAVWGTEGFLDMSDEWKRLRTNYQQ